MTIIVPDVSMSLLPATQKILNNEQKLLFVGQMTSGTATSGTLYENIGNNNEQDTLFGKKSMLATMIRAAKYYNKVSQIDAIPLSDNGSGSKAGGIVAFSGTTASAAGTITVTIGSKGNIPLLSHVYELTISSGESISNIGAALEAAITADTTAPVTAVNTSGSVAISAVHKGTEGNYIGIKVSGTVAGVSYTVTGMSAGATDPTLTTLYDVVGTTRYQTVVIPYYAATATTTFLDARFNVNKRILDGVAICCMTDSEANIVSAAAARNSQSLVILANKHFATPLLFYVAPGIFEIPTIIAAQFAAIRALRLTIDENIGQFASAAYGSKDSFGGMHIASLPYFNTVLPGLPLEESGKSFTDTELSALTTAGATVMGNNIANDNVILGTTVTTYKTDSAGNTDESFKYLEYVDTEVTCREYFFNNFTTRFRQSRLTSGDVIMGYNIANEEVISSYAVSLYSDLAELALVRIGKDPVTGVDWLAYFKQNLTVVLDLELGKATLTMKLPIVTQLRTIITSMTVSFNANS